VAPAPDCALFFTAGALLTCLTRNEPLQPMLAPVLGTWAASHAATHVGFLSGLSR
jgi:hypothetical protein